jgi:serine/threonine protein phosphatase PrpC
MSIEICQLYRFGNAVGYSETIGARPSMEDTLIVWRAFAPGLSMYGVIDGHGGFETAAQAAYWIPQFFRDIPSKSIGEMSTVFRLVNAELLKRNVRDGAAIVVTLIGPTEIGVAHLGDCRAVLIKQNHKFVSLTVDHKPTERSEIDLLKQNGSFVDANRTAGMLAVSRALGDFSIPGVGRCPSLTQYSRSPDDWRLVLACDGLFDVINNGDIAQIIQNEPNMQRAAYLLRNTALARGSQDNISVIVIDLTGSSKKQDSAF